MPGYFYSSVEEAAAIIAELGSERVRAALGARCADLHVLLPELGSSELRSDSQLAGHHRRSLPEKADLSVARSATERLIPQSAIEPGASDPESRFRVYQSVLQLLALDASPPPRVIVLDDLHASDATTLELLAYLAPELSRVPLLLLATLRGSERPATADAQRRLAYVLGHRNSQRIELARLTEGEVAGYARQVLGQDSVELARAVHQKSEGIPFFMVELVRRAHESGAGNASVLTFSDAALDLVRQRIRRLDADARGLLSAAAVIGRTFDLGLLSAAVEQPAAEVLEQLDDAFSSDVVIAAGDDPNRFVFAHDLIRDVLCEQLSQAELRRLRLRIGDALERRRQAGASVNDTEIAHHLLGALPEGSVERAVSYARSAAQQASAATAYADAAELLRRALAALDLLGEPQPRLRCELYYQLALDLRAFDVPASAEALNRSAALAREQRYGDVLILVGQMMAPSPGAVVVPEASSHLEQALASLGPDDGALRAVALAYLSWTPPHCYSRSASLRLADDALAAARASGSGDALGAALRAKLYLQGGPERPEHVTRALLDELRRLTLHEPHHSRARTAFELCTFEMVHALQRGDRPGFARAFASFGETAERYRFTELLWFHSRLGTVDRMNRGDYGPVPAELEELRNVGERLQLYAYDMMWGFDNMLLHLEQHGFADVPDQRVEPAPPPTDDPPNVRAIKLRTLVDLHHRDSARVLLRLFVAHGLSELPCDRDYLGTLAHLAAAAVALDERDVARQLYPLLEPHAACFATDITLHCRGSIAHYAGLLARALGRSADAEAHFAHAIAQNEALSFAPRAAESRYELARTLAGSDDARARTLCSEATNTANALGLRPLSNKLEQLKSELGD
jgi:hypothetical protein